MHTILSNLVVSVSVAGIASLAAAGPQSMRVATVVQKNDTPSAKSGDKPVENFLRNARVGDWVSYKSSGPTPSTFKQTVIAKTADEITLRSEIKVGDMALPATEVKVNLREQFDPDKPSRPDVKTTIEKLGTGKEALDVGDKRYECTWVKNRVTQVSGPTANAPATTSVSVAKKWTSKDVPLSGMVKSEVEVAGQTTLTELTGFGRGK